VKYSHLKQILSYLQQFKKVVTIYRVDDNLLKMVFDKEQTLYFDMRRSHSKIFKTDKEIGRSKVYNAPFDIMLARRLHRSTIEKVEIVGNDKILRFTTIQDFAYKSQRTLLQFEFTAKHTNVIILDESLHVLEALRHVDLFASFREVRVGQKLLDAPGPKYTPKEYPLDDVEQFLYTAYEQEYAQRL